MPATEITSPGPCQLSWRKGPGGWHGFCFLFFSLQSRWVYKVSRDVPEPKPQIWAPLNSWQVWIRFWMHRLQIRCDFNNTYPLKALPILPASHCTVTSGVLLYLWADMKCWRGRIDLSLPSSCALSLCHCALYELQKCICVSDVCHWQILVTAWG